MKRLRPYGSSYDKIIHLNYQDIWTVMTPCLYSKKTGLYCIKGTLKVLGDTKQCCEIVKIRWMIVGESMNERRNSSLFAYSDRKMGLCFLKTGSILALGPEFINNTLI